MPSASSLLARAAGAPHARKRTPPLSEAPHHDQVSALAPRTARPGQRCTGEDRIRMRRCGRTVPARRFARGQRALRLPGRDGSRYRPLVALEQSRPGLLGRPHRLPRHRSASPRRRLLPVRRPPRPPHLGGRPSGRTAHASLRPALGEHGPQRRPVTGLARPYSTGSRFFSSKAVTSLRYSSHSCFLLRRKKS